jgi:hypothetical protein
MNQAGYYLDSRSSAIQSTIGPIGSCCDMRWSCHHVWNDGARAHHNGSSPLADLELRPGRNPAHQPFFPCTGIPSSRTGTITNRNRH